MDVSNTSFCKITGHTKEVSCCTFSGEYFVTCSGDKSIRIFSAKDFKEKEYSPLMHHKYGVNCVQFNFDGSRLASASTDGTAVIWEFKGEEPTIYHSFVHSDSNTVQVCSFSPNSSMLVTGSSDGAIAVWNIAQKTKIFKFIGHPDGNVNAVSFTPCNEYLVTGSGVGDIRVWDLRYQQSVCGVCILQTQAHGNGVSGCGVDCICFSPSFHIIGPGQTSNTYLMASCGQDNLIKLWIFQKEIAVQASGKRDYSARCLEPLQELAAHNDPVSLCCFSPDGLYLASCSFDKNVVIWNPVTAEKVCVLEGHSAIVTSVSFSLDGKYLASTSYDKSTIVWKLDGSNDLQMSSSTADEVLGTSDALVDLKVSDDIVKHVHQWSTDDVASWLEDMQLGQYSESFKQNAIDGEELVNLTSESLSNDLRIGPLGHRNKILRGIETLKASQIDNPVCPSSYNRGQNSNPVFLPVADPKNGLPSITATPKLAISDEDIKDEYLCPISREVMMDPVLAADGFTYERVSIESWFKRGRNVSPMTNQRLTSRNLVPNQALKTIILQFLESAQGKKA